MIGSRPPVSFLEAEDVRERMSGVGYLDPSFILKTDDTVAVSVDKNIYNISTNLEMKFIKTYVTDTTITLPSENHGIQEVLVNLEVSNDSPAFGEIDDYTVDGQTIDVGTNFYDGKLAYVKFLTVKS
jgi:hypothetical protein